MTAGLRTSAAGRLRSEEGFGLVEVVVSAALFLLVAGTALGTLTRAEAVTKGSQAQESATSIAQREAERMREQGYAALGLSSLPTGAAAGPDSNPSNPDEYVSADKLLVRTNFRDRTSPLAPYVPPDGEPLITVATNGVATGPQQVVAGTSTFEVHRYVTRVDMQCMVNGTDKCPGTEDAKRIVVAVAPVNPGPGTPAKPVWISTMLANPAATAPGATPPPPVSGASNLTAQPFSLYDTACDEASRQAITGSHPVHDTSVTATCVAGAPARLDLMGPSSPPAPAAGDPMPPHYDYATDSPTPRTGGTGLALERPAGGLDCAGSYVVAAADRYTAHRWASTPIPSGGFQSGTRSALSVVTKTSSGATGEATLCLALFEMSAAGLVSPSPLTPTVSHRIAAPGWPAEAAEVSFAFDHPAFSLDAGERIVIALWIAGTSLPEGIEIQYDHPRADTVLSVGTTTPLS
jgi:type II secretory pathway pseudopilin PulG